MAYQAYSRSSRLNLEDRRYELHRGELQDLETAADKVTHDVTAISFGATLLSAVLGRSPLSATTVGKATTAARGVGRASRQALCSTRDAERRNNIRSAAAIRMSGHPEPNTHTASAAAITANPSRTSFREHSHTEDMFTSLCLYR